MEHEKLYQDETEEQLRMKIFIENREWIAKHNQLYALGLVSYKLGVTPFADMSQQEFMEIFNGYQSSAESEE